MDMVPHYSVFSDPVIFLRPVSEKLEKTWSHWLSPVKVLLEQGDPFTDTFMRKDVVRFSIGLFMLMGIILSNGYKNSNVYNMILPKSPIPYKLFNELIQDDFTIYTRVSHLQASLSWLPYSNDSGPFLARKVNNLYLYVLSEISKILVNFGKSGHTTYDSSASRLLTTNTTLHKTGVLRASILHPLIDALLYPIIAAWNNRAEDEVGLGEAIVLGRKSVRATFQMMQDELPLLLESLRKCDKVAVILPEYICRNVSKVLRKNDALASVSIGEEVISDVHWLFSLKGFVPSYITKRIAGAHESGFWMYWEGIFRESDGDKEIVPVAAATMNGNIAVIFLVWLCGLLGTVLSYVYEILRNVVARLC